MINGLLKITAVFLLLNALAATGWWWSYNIIEKAETRIEDLRFEVALVEAKQKNTRVLTETLREISEQKSRIEDVFVEEKTLVGFIEELEKTALISGVDLEITSASLPTADGNSGPSFNLSVDGSFGRLLKFVAILEKMNYQLKMDSVRFSSVDNGWVLQVRLVLLSYTR